MSRTFLQNLCILFVFLAALGLVLWLGLREGKTVSMDTRGVELSQKESWETAIHTPIEEQNPTVYLTQSGGKYHASAECSSLKRSKNILQTTRSDAERQGKEPCALCYGS